MEQPAGEPSASLDGHCIEDEFNKLAHIDVDDIVPELPQCSNIAVREATLINPIRTASFHHQLRDLLHFSSVEPDWAYVSADSGITRISLSNEKETFKLPPAFQSDWQKSHGLACAFGFLGTVSGSELTIYWEKTGQIVYRQSINQGGQANSIMWDRWGDRVVIVIGQNGGVIRVVQLLLSPTQQQQMMDQWSPPFEFKEKQVVSVTSNINFVAVDAQKRILMAAPDHKEHPIFFELDAVNAEINPTPLVHTLQYAATLPARDGNSLPSQFRVVAARQLFPDQLTVADSMQVAWAPIGSLCAAVLDRGMCFVWDWEKQQQVAAFCSVESPQPTDAARARWYYPVRWLPIRLVKFSPSSKYPVLAFAELSTYIHVVHTKTLDRQILQLPEHASINGMTFTKDGSKLYVAHSHGITVFRLVPRESLVDLCTYFIAQNKDQWSDWGWELDYFPEEVWERIEELL